MKDENDIAKAREMNLKAKLHIAYANELLEQARALLRPKEPIAESADAPPVISFQKDFGGNSPVYNYAAIAVQPSGGRDPEEQHWYVTGAVHGKKRWSWDELLEFIGTDYWNTIVELQPKMKG